MQTHIDRSSAVSGLGLFCITLWSCLSSHFQCIKVFIAFLGCTYCLLQWMQEYQQRVQRPVVAFFGCTYSFLVQRRSKVARSSILLLNLLFGGKEKVQWPVAAWKLGGKHLLNKHLGRKRWVQHVTDMTTKHKSIKKVANDNDLVKNFKSHNMRAGFNELGWKFKVWRHIFNK